jgi:hypothetical protein
MATNVPPITFTITGFSGPNDSTILAGVVADINAAFGGNLNHSLTTPQGQLASSFTSIVSEVNATFLLFQNLVDPSYTFGRYQDGIGRIYFLNRNPALPTTVQAICSGLAGVTIPIGALAQAADGSIYACTGSGTIPSTGSITLSFANNTVGPIPCPAGTLNAIYQAVPGWDSINNPSDGTLGQNTESRTQFEQRRAASVAGNSRGAVQSVLGAVLAVPGVLGAYVTENPNATPLTIQGFTLSPNSLYVAVAGGAASAVAQAIWSKKAPGCAYNGNTTFTVQDTSTGYSSPFPSYTVSWQTPAALPIIFSVNLVSTPQVPSNANTLVQNAIVSAFAGGDGGTVATIGSTILASRYYPPVSALGPWAQIRSLQIGSSNTASASVLGYVQGTTLSVTTLQSGLLAVGQTLVGGLVGGSSAAGGSGIVAGTTITALGSGVGGTGTYTISISQNLGASFLGTSGSGATLTVASINGAIGIGDTLSNGTAVGIGITITGQLSGTIGGNGVYTTSSQLGLSGLAMQASVPIQGVLANQNSVSVNINQIPTINIANIVVTVT